MMGNYISIDLLRHGETECKGRYIGKTDPCLTTEGWSQMRSATTINAFWQRIVTSPLRRCLEFAHSLAIDCAIPLHIDDRLQELDFGRWENQTAEALWQTDADALTQFWRDPWSFHPPDGESLRSLQSRVLAAWRDIIAMRLDTLVVAHGGPIRILLSSVNRLPPKAILAIDVPPASLQRLRVEAV